MFARRMFAAAAVLLAAGSAVRSETFVLAEPVQAGDCFHVAIDMKLTGEIRVHQNDNSVKLPLTTAAAHDFQERVLAADADGLIHKTARVYATANADIKVSNNAAQRTLRPDRRLVVAQRDKQQLLAYSTGGAFTQEELAMAHDHFNTLVLPGLLPGKAVAVGDTWKIPNAVAQEVCLFEGLTEQTLTGKLEDVKDGVAVFSITGASNGIDDGAMVKTIVTATGKFDLQAKRVVELSWTQKDERDQGPVSPASTVEATTTLTRKAIDQPQCLSDVALVSAPSDAPPASLTQLEFRDPKGRFSFLYGREWQITSQTDGHVVLRLLDNGDFVAQATLTPWTTMEKGKHLTPEAFRDAMNDTPGWEPAMDLQDGEAPSTDDRWIYRLSQLGKMDNVDVLQNFYLVAAPTGEQMVAAVTLTPKQADKLGARDLSLVGGIELPAPAEKK
ncbi:MAG TPA: hypothetical protein VMS17_12205 [Gemmataceae bacterium]|nr:hypothetical protein [Gemmataceae bacterium]